MNLKKFNLSLDVLLCVVSCVLYVPVFLVSGVFGRLMAGRGLYEDAFCLASRLFLFETGVLIGLGLLLQVGIVYLDRASGCSLKAARVVCVPVVLGTGVCLCCLLEWMRLVPVGLG